MKRKQNNVGERWRKSAERCSRLVRKLPGTVGVGNITSATFNITEE